MTPSTAYAHSARAASPSLRALLRLRLEELLALAFLLPCCYLTVVANLYARREGMLGDRLPGAIVRLGFAAAFLLFVLFLARSRPRRPGLVALRELLPLVACILIYTNLHDTVGFVNPRDISVYLAALDQTLFGVQPSVWTQRFITPERTEVMSFFYLSFFWLAPATPLVLLLRGRWREFRSTAFTLVLCFYAGYLLYVLFPAAPPRFTLAYDYKVSLRGYPQLFSNLEARAFELLPVDSRAAFPSLHVGATLVTLVCAWRYSRRLFWALLPMVLGLWVSTIYLRHHYFVDLVAGWLLGAAALAAAPRLDAWWAQKQLAQGVEPARGAVSRPPRKARLETLRPPPATAEASAGAPSSP